MPKKKDTKKAEEMLGDLSGHLLNDMHKAVDKVEKQPATPAAGISPSSFPSLDAQGIPIKQPQLNYFQEYGTTGLFRLGP